MLQSHLNTLLMQYLQVESAQPSDDLAENPCVRLFESEENEQERHDSTNADLRFKAFFYLLQTSYFKS